MDILANWHDAGRFNQQRQHVPYKHHENRRHKFTKPKDKVTNWLEYNAVLRRRGELTIWFTEEAITRWRPAKTGARGRPQEYSNVAIETAVPGGWSVLVKYGMAKKPLGTQRTGKVRFWRSVDTLLAYLRDELGICKVDGMDGRGCNPASVFRARPDAAARMRQAHAGLVDALPKMPNVGNDEDFARADDPMARARAGNKALKKLIEDGRP